MMYIIELHWYRVMWNNLFHNPKSFGYKQKIFKSKHPAETKQSFAHTLYSYFYIQTNASYRTSKWCQCISYICTMFMSTITDHPLNCLITVIWMWYNRTRRNALAPYSPTYNISVFSAGQNPNNNNNNIKHNLLHIIGSQKIKENCH